MYYYLDSSVILRWVLAEKNSIDIPKSTEGVFVSRLVQTECLRVLERLLKVSVLTENEYAEVRKYLMGVLQGVSVVAIKEEILERAEAPFATIVGTLDSIHLATCLALISFQHVPSQDEITFLTHDEQLARAARASGISVEGC